MSFAFGSWRHISNHLSSVQYAFHVVLGHFRPTTAAFVFHFALPKPHSTTHRVQSSPLAQVYSHCNQLSAATMGHTSYIALILALIHVVAGRPLVRNIQSTQGKLADNGRCGESLVMLTIHSFSCCERLIHRIRSPSRKALHRNWTTDSSRFLF